MNDYNDVVASAISDTEKLFQDIWINVEIENFWNKKLKTVVAT